MRQDKLRGVVIIDKDKYTEKGLALLARKKFQKLNFYTTKFTEETVQRMIRKIKSKFKIKRYNSKLFPVLENFMVRLSYIKLIQKD